MTGFAWHDALLADVGLGAAYVVYGYAYHLAFDRVRPLRDGEAGPAHEDASRAQITADPRPSCP
jgi:uncharacterized membrane protein